MHETTTKILEATSWLSAQLRPIVQAPPLPAVYAADPTVYARGNYEAAMQRLADGPRRLLLVGMNPGPHGMAIARLKELRSLALLAYGGSTRSVDSPSGASV